MRPRPFLSTTGAIVRRDGRPVGAVVPPRASRNASIAAPMPAPAAAPRTPNVNGTLNPAHSEHGIAVAPPSAPARAPRPAPIATPFHSGSRRCETGGRPGDKAAARIAPTSPAIGARSASSASGARCARADTGTSASGMASARSRRRSCGVMHTGMRQPLPARLTSHLTGGREAVTWVRDRHYYLR
jgi:hypothetical protein